MTPTTLLHFRLTLLTLLTLLALLTPTPINTFPTKTLKPQKIPTNEEIIFNLVNSIRKNLYIKPLKFSNTLYKKAQTENKSLIQNKNQNNKLLKTNYQNIQPFYKIFKKQNNLINIIFKSIKTSFHTRRTITSKEYKNFAISIIKNNNYYHCYLIFQKKPTKNNNDTPYLKEKKDFYKILNFLAKKTIQPNQSQKQIKNTIQPLINSFDRTYKMLSSPQELTIFQNEPKTPENHLKITFSPSPKSSSGLYNISLSFKEANYQEIQMWLEKTYKLNIQKNQNTTSYTENPYKFYRFDENKKLLFIIDNEKLFRLNWKNKEGIYLSISYLNLCLKYINNHKQNYKLKKTLSKWLYYRLLTEFLKTASPTISTVDFIHQTRIYFFKNEKEIDAYIDKNKLRFRYLYDYETGRRKIEEIYKNGIKTKTLRLP